MVGIYLVVEAVGLGIIAWSFKAEDKVTYSTAFGIAGGFSLLLAVLAAPISILGLTALLIGLFHSKLNIDWADAQAALLNFFKPFSHLMPETMSSVLNLPIFGSQQAQQSDNAHYPNMAVIDVDAVEVSRWF